MDAQMPEVTLLMDLEARHEELLRRLDDLDKRVEKTLAECQGCRTGTLQNPKNAEAA
jgi:hypothetical protein